LKGIVQQSLTQQSFDILINCPKNAKALANGLSILNSINRLTAEFRDILISDPQNAYTLSNGIKSLYYSGLLTPENLGFIVRCSENAESVSQGFVALLLASIFSQENRDELLRGKGAHSLVLLGNLTPDIPLTQERFIEIMEAVWGPSLFTARLFAQRNRSTEGIELPDVVIANIAKRTAPNYEHDPRPPFDVLGRIEAINARPTSPSNIENVIP
jgi:hypothetical protein